MSEFLVLHFGFEPPSPEDMANWKAWFESIGDVQIDRGHLPAGREISGGGRKGLPFGRSSLTGYTMIRADNLDHAEQIAAECPFVDSTQVYEIKK